MYEYTSAVFAVGLHGFAQVDNDRITSMSADGWEPAHMTPVHGGFAAVVLFRREAGASAAAAPTRTGRATANKTPAARTRKVPPPAAPTRSRRTAAVPPQAAAPSRKGRVAAPAAKATPAAPGRRTRAAR